MENTLLIDCCVDSGFILNLNESTKETNGLVTFRGKFQEAEAINKNKRSYPKQVLDANVKQLQEAIRDRRLIGELDHPTDSIVHFANASHLVTKLWWEGNILMGEGQILNTPYGKILKALINDGVKIGISSRGVGSGKVNEAGVLVIGESYKLITFDAVADPSTYAAFQEKVVGGQYEHTLQTNYIRNSNIPVMKNESKRIDTVVNKDALIALFGSAVKSQVEKVKARLS